MKLAIIGAGLVAQTFHIPAFLSHEGVEITAIYDRRIEKAEAVAEPLGAKAYDDYDELLKDENVDAVSICTRTDLHCPMAVKAARAGKNIFLEKPMAMSAHEAQQIADAVEENGVILEKNIAEIRVSGDKTLLSMLLYNLTENAIKACKKGGKVKISCSPHQLVVEDNGKGMTPEQLTHITEPFYRTDKSRSRSEGGAGLGLALCKQIAEAHKAVIRFESVPEKGTKITVDFTS